MKTITQSQFVIKITTLTILLCMLENLHIGEQVAAYKVKFWAQY